MPKVIIAFFCVLLFECSSLIAQKDIHEFTISIVDTNASKYEQAKDIYTWITHNISYDVNALKKIKNNEKNLEDIISSRKGLCYDYSQLFSAMCKSVNIEAYSIAGYNKSMFYYKGKPFTRSEHTWNMFYADSAWHTVDATWGSGFILFKPDLSSKLLNKALKIPYSNNNMVFIPKSDSAWFDIRPDSLVKTHYPLSQKWLLTENPLCFNYFCSDTTQKECSNPFYARDIETVRGYSDDNIYKVDGIDGNKLNRLNYFDLANGYYIISKSYDIERPVTEANLWQFDKYFADFTLILQSINRHKIISDSIYRNRIKSLKTIAGTQKRMTGKIKSKAKSAEKSFKSGKQQIFGKDASYRKKQEAFMINIGKTELKRFSKNEAHDSVPVELEELISLGQEVNYLKAQELNYIKSSDSLLKSIDKHISSDALYDDSIYAENNKFNLNIVSLEDLILTGDEMLIRSYVDSLSYIYSEISLLLEQKKGTKAKLQETSKNYYTTTAEYQKNLKEQMTLLGKMYKFSNYNDSILYTNNKCVDRLIGSYKQSIEFTRKVSDHGLMQNDIRKQNLIALKQQKKNIVRENKYFIKWYSALYKRETAKYTSEKELAAIIKSDAQRKQKLVETKVKKYREIKE